MRSASAPQPWRARKTAPQHHREHRRTMGARDADVAAEGDEMRRRHRHRDAAAETGQADQRLGETGMQAGDAADLGRWERSRADGSRRCRHRRGRLQGEGGRQDEQQDDTAIGQHRDLPADSVDGALEQRRPRHTGDVLAGGDQRDRGSTPTIEPAADIDQQRRIDAAIAQQADHQAMADIERPDRADRTQRQTTGDHAGADDDGGAHTDAIGEPAHEDATGARADPDQGACERQHRTAGAERVLHRLHADHDQQRRTVRNR
jgi:hypothetical protein